MARHDPRQVLEAGVALANYRAPWVDSIDVPTAVVLTARDRAVEPFVQLRMAARIPGATVHPVEDGHITYAKPSFAPVLRSAIDSVVARSGIHARIAG